jgi:hypothetical protein
LGSLAFFIIIKTRGKYQQDERGDDDRFISSFEPEKKKNIKKKGANAYFILFNFSSLKM